MATRDVSLLDAMKAWVVSRVSGGRSAASRDHVRDLIRRDREKAAKIAHGQRLITEAEEGGHLGGTMEERRGAAPGWARLSHGLAHDACRL